MSKLIILDGYSFLFRYFYAMPPYLSGDNVPLNAVRGCANRFIKILKGNPGASFCCALDAGGPTFRNKIDPEYKANRVEVPKDLIPQFDAFDDMLQSLGINGTRRNGYEADDIIASYVRKYGNSCDITIFTADKDLMQLVSENVKILNLSNNNIFTVKEVEEKYGIKPSQISDYLSIVGDSADNIKGIPGVGPKTAVKLLNEYPNANAIYSDIDNIKPEGLRLKLQDGKEQWAISRDLVALYDNIDKLEELEVLKHGGFNDERLDNFLERNRLNRSFFSFGISGSEGKENQSTNSASNSSSNANQQLSLF